MYDLRTGHIRPSDLDGFASCPALIMFLEWTTKEVNIKS